MNFTPEQPHRSREIDLTSLINIVFLILVFFMLAGSLGPRDSIQPAVVDTPDSGENATLVLEVNVSGAIMIKGELIAPSALPSLLERHQSSGGTIALKPDARLPANELIALTAQLRTAGFTQLTLLVDGAR